MEDQNTQPPVLQVTQTPSSEPVSNIKKPKPKFPLALIVGIVLFLLIAGSAAGFYVYKQQSLKSVVKPAPTSTIRQTPTPDPTADWNTYENKNYGYSIKHPNGWVVLRPDADEDAEYCLEKPANDGQVVIYMAEIPNGKSCQDISMNISRPGKTDSLIITVDPVPLDLNDPKLFPTKSDVLVNGFPSILVTTKSNLNSNQITLYQYYINQSNKTYEILFAIGGNEDINRSTISQILSTFKFTDAQTVDTSNWKIYEGNGASFKYPADFSVKTDTNGSTQTTVDFTINKQTIRFEDLVSEYKVTPNRETKIIKEFNNLSWYEDIVTAKDCDAGACGLKRMSYYIYKNGRIYSFYFDGLETQSTVTQILSTFKFTQ